MFNLPQGTPPRLIFHTLFGSGVNLGAVISGGADRHTQDITGTDSVTGFSFDSGSLLDFYGANVYPYILSIYDSSMYANGGATHPYYNECFANSIQSSTNLSNVPGARELLLKCLSITQPTPEVNPQAGFILGRGRVAGVALADIPELFYSFDFILQSDLTTKMSDTYYSATNYMVLTELKTGDYNSTNGVSWGDFRLIINIYRNASVNGGKLYFYTRIDNEANGRTRVPSVGDSLVIYQESTVIGTDADGNDVCPLNVPLRVEVWIKRPKMIYTRSGAGTTSDAYEKDTTTGHIQVVITNLNTECSTVIAEFIGGIQAGNENLPWQRHLVCNAYGRPLAPFEHRMTNLRIWSGKDRVIV